MMPANLSEWLSATLILLAAFFFLAGTVGLLRFPDVFTRLHALTKADNVGLGLLVAGLAIHTGWWAAGKLIVIWLLVLGASALVAHSIARAALRLQVRPWRRP
jgi:multicomponent Na+:H+ antiporter subunit G